MDIDLALLGHGELITERRTPIDEALRCTSAVREKLLRLIAERVRSAYELAQALWGNVALTGPTSPIRGARSP